MDLLLKIGSACSDPEQLSRFCNLCASIRKQMWHRDDVLLQWCRLYVDHKWRGRMCVCVVEADIVAAAMRMAKLMRSREKVAQRNGVVMRELRCKLEAPFREQDSEGFTRVCWWKHRRQQQLRMSEELSRLENEIREVEGQLRSLRWPPCSCIFPSGSYDGYSYESYWGPYYARERQVGPCIMDLAETVVDSKCSREHHVWKHSSGTCASRRQGRAGRAEQAGQGRVGRQGRKNHKSHRKADLMAWQIG